MEYNAGDRVAAAWWRRVGRAERAEEEQDFWRSKARQTKTPALRRARASVCVSSLDLSEILDLLSPSPFEQKRQ